MELVPWFHFLSPRGGILSFICERDIMRIISFFPPLFVMTLPTLMNILAVVQKKDKKKKKKAPFE